jgi:hypothetical protein
MRRIFRPAAASLRKRRTTDPGGQAAVPASGACGSKNPLLYQRERRECGAIPLRGGRAGTQPGENARSSAGC